MFKAKVTVMLKKSVLDPQGAAVERALKSYGDNEFSGVRVGKVVEFTVGGADAESARKKVEELADRLLANPVMEDYSVSVEPVA